MAEGWSRTGFKVPSRPNCCVTLLSKRFSLTPLTSLATPAHAGRMLPKRSPRVCGSTASSLGKVAGQLGTASLSLNLGTLPKITHYIHTPIMADDTCETSTASNVISWFSEDRMMLI